MSDIVAKVRTGWLPRRPLSGLYSQRSLSFVPRPRSRQARLSLAIAERSVNHIHSFAKASSGPTPTPARFLSDIRRKSSFHRVLCPSRVDCPLPESPACPVQNPLYPYLHHRRCISRQHGLRLRCIRGALQDSAKLPPLQSLSSPSEFFRFALLTGVVPFGIIDRSILTCALSALHPGATGAHE